MKKIILFFIIILATSCLPSIDKDPCVKIEIDENTISKIDSLDLETYDEVFNEINVETKNIGQEVNTYYFSSWENEGNFIIKLKNNIKIKTKKVKLNNVDKLVLSETNGNYNFTRENELPIRELTIKCIIALLIIILVKLPCTFFIRTIHRRELVLKYTVLYLFFLFLSFLLYIVFDYYELKLGFVFLIIFLIFPNLIDIYSLNKYSQAEIKEKSIFSILVSNFLLLIFWLYLSRMIYI